MGEGPDSVVGASSRSAPRSSRGTTLWSRRSILTGLAAATTMACTGQRGPGSTTTTIPRVAAGPATALPPLADWRVTRWAADPWSRGAYSYLAPGTSPVTRRSLAHPVDDRLFFAGEATDPDHPGTVHGALASGQRAAGEVVASRRSGPTVVVGAGVAGLGAAQALTAVGHDVVVVEARDRVGGRVWSVDVGDAVIDLGGSWLHGLRDNPVADLATSLGIDLVPTDYDNALLFDADGSPLPWPRLDHLYDLVADLLGSSRSSGSMAAAVAEVRSGVTGDDRRYLEYVLASEVDHWFAAGPEALAFTGVHEGSWSRGGDAVPATSYRPIVDHLADGLDIRMGHPVSVVRSEADGVRVVTDGGEFVGATVVVTVPLGVLQAGTIRFEPELPRAKVAAIDSLGMGVMDKVVLRFEEAFWDPDVDLVAYTADRSGYFVEWYNAVPWTGRPILVGFNAGRPAAEIESWSDDETLDAALDVLRRIRW